MKINVRKSVLRANDEQARNNAYDFSESKIIAVNVMASPGAGKTSLIIELALALRSLFPVYVIEGDCASSIDREKIAEHAIPVVQINTGGGCHLTAKMVKKAFDELKMKGPAFLFIENIGNLICPAEFDLGEKLRMVIASVPEGDDKPQKYPGIFACADVVLLNKIDLRPYLNFQTETFVKGVEAVNEDAEIFEVSCRTKEGIQKVASRVSRFLVSVQKKGARAPLRQAK